MKAKEFKDYDKACKFRDKVGGQIQHNESKNEIHYLVWYTPKEETELSKKEKLLKQIEFEEKWLLDVYVKDRKVSFKDINIAIGAIKKAVKEMD